MTNESIPSHNSEYVPKHAKKEQAEVLPDARQRYKRKVEGYYLSGGHPDYLSSYDVHITGYDHERAISLINGGRIDDRADDALLRRVEPAIGQRGENAYDVVYNINQSETAVRQGKLINYFTGAEHARPSGIGVDEVKSFYRPLIQGACKDYYSSSSIPFREKALFSVLYVCPWAVWLMMKLTKN